MRIVFMGTPDFAVPSFEKLMNSSHQVMGVVTQPDRPKGRGLKVAFPPVKRCAQKYNLNILQPLDLKDSSLHAKLKLMKADCFVVVAFQILPPDVYKLPPLGALNLHASLLPRYRGAAPIQWAIMNGEKETGLTTFKIQKKVDTGDVLLQKRVSIQPNDTAGDLHDRMSQIGADLLLQTLDGLENQSLQPVPQQGKMSQAPKIQKHHCEISWNNSTEMIRNQIRGLSPLPGAFSFLYGKRIKIYQGQTEESLKDVHPNHDKTPGSIIDIKSERLVVATGDGFLDILEVQLEGKKRMSASDFLRGYKLESNTILGRL